MRSHPAFERALKHALLKERFLWVIGANPQNDEWYTTTFWGIVLPDDACSATDDQSFENRKSGLGNYEKNLTLFPHIELGTYHYGYTLMPCGCSDEIHRSPIVLYDWLPVPKHSADVGMIHQKPPGLSQPADTLCMSVNGGVLRAMPKPAPEGALALGILVLRVEPYQLLPRT